MGMKILTEKTVRQIMSQSEIDYHTDYRRVKDVAQGHCVSGGQLKKAIEKLFWKDRPAILKQANVKG